MSESGSKKAGAKRASKRAQRTSANATALPVLNVDDGLYLADEAERALFNRLSRLEGQVRGVKKMLTAHQSCDAMLMQVSAMKQAVNGIAAELL